MKYNEYIAALPFKLSMEEPSARIRGALDA